MCVMKISKLFLSLFAVIALLFVSCEEKDKVEEFEFMQNGEVIYFSQDSDIWQAKPEDLGSYYAVVDNKENPTWCDIVVCSENLKDFDVEILRKYLFLHFEFSENQTPKNIIAEFYKNKSANQAGVFDLMLVHKRIEVSLRDLNEEKISGKMIGQMQSKVNSNDVRDVVFVFKDIPLKTPDELK